MIECNYKRKGAERLMIKYQDSRFMIEYIKVIDKYLLHDKLGVNLYSTKQWVLEDEIKRRLKQTITTFKG